VLTPGSRPRVPRARRQGALPRRRRARSP
jgi:hypothetical protein